MLFQLKTEIPAFFNIGAGALQLFVLLGLSLSLMLMHFLMTSDFSNYGSRVPSG